MVMGWLQGHCFCNRAGVKHRIQNLAFDALLSICEVIDKALDLEKALDEVLRILSETLSMNRATITLLDTETGQLSINASYGLTLEEKQRGVYNLDEGVTGRIFQTVEPFVVPDVSQEPLFLNKTGARRIDKGRIAFIGVPIILHSQAIGVLNVDRLFSREVSFEEDIGFLQVVATLIAQFMSLNEEVRQREQVLRQENISLMSRMSRNDREIRMVGSSPAMLEVQQKLEKVAPTKATVLLLGESGVGKTRIARVIHQFSERRHHPFIKVNCASIPETLLESELFGYDKGAFTGASQTRSGRFEEADQGTVFLDEIGELPLAIQAKLLRFIQDREFERLGSNQTRRADVRIIAATNRDLEELSSTGEFRPDLYYRLNVFPIRVPPLRERSVDIPGLLNHFLAKVSQEYGRTLHFSPRALDSLTAYGWPGNVREMENLIERVVIMSDGQRVNLASLEAHLHSRPPKSDGGSSPCKDLSAKGPSLEDMEKATLLEALERNDWVQKRAARDLRLSDRQMRYRVRKFELEAVIAQGKAHGLQRG